MVALQTSLLSVFVTGLTFLFGVAPSYCADDCDYSDCDEFQLPPEEVIARAGSMALMPCVYDGIASVIWDKGLTNIISGDACDCYIHPNGTLQFNNISLIDEGCYTCNAIVGFGASQRCGVRLRVAIVYPTTFPTVPTPSAFSKVSTTSTFSNVSTPSAFSTVSTTSTFSTVSIPTVSTPSAFPTVSTPSASSRALIIILPFVFITFTTVLVIGFLFTWKIWKRKYYFKKNVNRSSKHGRIVERELPELPSLLPPMSFIEQLKEELGRRNMLYLKHHLQLTKVIGEGESGLVYRGYITGNVCVAVKTGKALISENHKEKLLKEITLMMSFKHPNVMPLVGMCFDGEVPLLIMPLMSNGSVLDYIRNNEGVLYCTEMSSEEQILAARKKCMDICHQIAKGMSYLAMKRFVHRDLAARNCMIDGFANGVIKVADFGMAEDMYGTNYCNYSSQEREERVPLKWMAPESIEKNLYSESSDVWSYGVTCWEVFTCGRIPYSGVPVMTLLSELRSGQRLDRPTNRTCSDSIWSVIKDCWSFDSEERPKFNDIVKETADLLDYDSAYFKL